LKTNSAGSLIPLDSAKGFSAPLASALPKATTVPSAPVGISRLGDLSSKHSKNPRKSREINAPQLSIRLRLFFQHCFCE
jgi:hypothetical protein